MAKKAAAKKTAPKKTTAAKKAPAKKPAAEKKEPVKILAKGREVEIPVFGTTVKAMLIMQNARITLFRSVDSQIFIQVPTDIVPKEG
jgi:hypothetical protein